MLENFFDKKKIEQVKTEKRVTEKQAQDWIKSENLTTEELKAMQERLRKTVENSTQVWNSFDPSKLFGQ